MQKKQWKKDVSIRVLTRQDMLAMKTLSKEKGVRYDLTQPQWRRTVEHFHGLCAYCQRHPWQQVEHFIPMSLGGGTWVGNVVPACMHCNDEKSDLHPDQVTAIPQEDIQRVRAYLEQYKDVTNFESWEEIYKLEYGQRKRTNIVRGIRIGRSFFEHINYYYPEISLQEAVRIIDEFIEIKMLPWKNDEQMPKEISGMFRDYIKEHLGEPVNKK